MEGEGEDQAFEEAEEYDEAEEGQDYALPEDDHDAPLNMVRLLESYYLYHVANCTGAGCRLPRGTGWRKQQKEEEQEE